MNKYKVIAENVSAVYEANTKEDAINQMKQENPTLDFSNVETLNYKHVDGADLSIDEIFQITEDFIEIEEMNDDGVGDYADEIFKSLEKLRSYLKK